MLRAPKILDPALWLLNSLVSLKVIHHYMWIWETLVSTSDFLSVFSERFQERSDVPSENDKTNHSPIRRKNNVVLTVIISFVSYFLLIVMRYISA